ncbi:hypothetical protein [Ralstonia mannitolilytica]|uniref:hypothetical protein n=1 Tax=Ralstonia mannitolilytica TaxID=105219 RepID=UPI000CED9661|nr:hypothetical protein [Ralstonia mannitolilytica]
MALPDTSVKVFTSADAGAPVLSGQAGALLAILNACLLNGFNLKSATSLTASSGTATLTANGHGFKVNQVVLVSGASDPLHNGEKRITAVTTNTITYAVDPAAAANPTGTISVKMAPLAWNSPFTGTNLAVYTSASPQSLGMLLRVDDTGTTNGRVVGYESMTDVNTGTGAFPTAQQIAGGMYWPKSGSANANVIPWYIIGDSRGFYYWSASYAGPTNNQAYLNGVCTWFGDPILLSSVDAFGTVLSGCSADRAAATSFVGECMSAAPVTTANASYNPRSFVQTGSAVACWRYPGIFSGGYSGQGGSAWAGGTLSYPNQPDNGLITTPLYTGNQGNVRAVMPGVYHSPQALAPAFNHLDLIPGQDALAGRTLQIVRTGQLNLQTPASYLFFDITGPWR